MSKANYHGLILAGGRGTRFWPRSRRARAKQVLNFFGERSLIQQTVDRLAPVIPPERLWVLTNDHLVDEIRRQLPGIPARQIVAEPAQRNTAPAIGLAAHMIASVDPQAVMGVFPSDHVISRDAAYRNLIRQALRAAAAGSMVVLGIKPRWPETGYGYIEFGTKGPGAMPVKSFREKPDLATAKKMLRAGRFAWNAGVFFWRAATLLDAMRRHLPRTATLLAGLPPFGARDFAARLAEVYPHCENISIDYAVMEKAPGVIGFAAGDIGWNDVGSWNAVYELAAKDSAGNAARGETVFLESSGNYVDGGRKLVALAGVQDLVVVDTADALLVVDRKQAQKVGDVVKLLERLKRDEVL